MRSPKIHWYDSETTGLKANEHQMLTFAMVTTSMDLTIESVFDKQIRLRPEITPTKEALSINKIDPYSLMWHAESMEEKDFCVSLNNYFEKHYQLGDIFVAYSARFDNGFLKGAFQRNSVGLYVTEQGSVKCVDPLILVKEGTGDGRLATPQLYSAYQKGLYNSSKLEHVSRLFGAQHQGPAHNALNDVYTLINTTPKLVTKLLENMPLEVFFKQNKYQVVF